MLLGRKVRIKVRNDHHDLGTPGSSVLALNPTFKKIAQDFSAMFKQILIVRPECGEGVAVYVEFSNH
jgi:hypothetical protein